MSRQPDLHPSLAVLHQLYLQPVHLQRSGVIRVILTSVDHWQVSLPAWRQKCSAVSQVFESYQKRVFSDKTARRSGITSTEKYAPRSKTWRSSSGMNFFQILTW